MSRKSILYKIVIAVFILGWIPAGFAQDNSGGTKGMQNLTARYNILFNARELVKESEQAARLAAPDNYGRLLRVFVESDASTAQSQLKNLDDAIAKANKITNEKNKSNYVDDAYLLIGIANHWKADYFNAVEFFNYVYLNYPKEKSIRQAALIWKGRSLMQLNRFEEAQAALDTALKYINTAKKLSLSAYAAKAQWHLSAKQYVESAALLNKAIKLSKDKKERIRWIYLLAQLEAMNGKTEEAYNYFTEVVKSNAPFEMAFNANLNRISIEEQQEGAKVNREQRLRALLKDEKNLQLTDQIYYHIGRNFELENKPDKAIENYNISIRKSTNNMDQKGLSYRALAEIYFKQADYVNAKKYYDSTLTALPAIHPDYELIRKKNSSLDLLTKNLIIIAEEDTLQMLAALPELERKLKIERMIAEKLKQSTPGQSANADTDFGSYNIQNSNSGNNKFYFNNPIALSQGFSDFKRRWGNRKLEDNWRISQRSLAESSTSLTAEIDVNQLGTTAQTEVQRPQNSADQLKKEYEFKLPDTAEKLAASDLRIADAYFEVGDYYREVLGDKAEAIRAFETLINRFPDYVNRAAVHYNLYRLYSGTDSSRSEFFKNRILEESPNSVFAKVILDPEFGKKQDEQDLALGRAYNQIFDQFAKKDYSEVMNCVRELNAGFGKNRLSAQLEYLNTISAGHRESLSPFENRLKAIIANFPDDKLITPLVKQHLEFIDQNRKAMSLRKVVLTDNEPLYSAMLEKPPGREKLKPSANLSSVRPAASDILPSAAAAVNPGQTETASDPKIVKPAQPTVQTDPAFKSIFDLKDTDHYYVVVNVADPIVNLSSSRFGFGQFNRANFPDGNIKHQLKEVNNENQLIFVGEFGSKETAEEYYRNILPLMRDIMKIPPGMYTTFIITKANLELIKDRETLKQYEEFYKKYYLK